MSLNLPNLLTWSRVIAIPVLVAVFFLPIPVFAQNLIATVLFVGAAITDWLDGWLARRMGITSAFGAFLDPVADKLIVCVALVMLVDLDRLVGVDVVVAAIIISALILKGNYKHVEKVLLFLCLSAFAYVITVFINKPDWGLIARESIHPRFHFNSEYILAMLAVVGTTITPWGIFYLQASIADKGIDLNQYDHTRVDVIFGAAWGNVISAFIMITTASTLFLRGIVVEEAAEAAMALEPLAGHFDRRRDLERNAPLIRLH